MGTEESRPANKGNEKEKSNTSAKSSVQSDSDSDTLIIDIEEAPASNPAKSKFPSSGNSPLKSQLTPIEKKGSQKTPTKSDGVNKIGRSKDSIPFPQNGLVGELRKDEDEDTVMRPPANVKEDFEKVEDAMEAMFAGVEGECSDVKPIQKHSTVAEKKKPGRKPTADTCRPRKRGRPLGSSSSQDSAIVNGKVSKIARRKDKQQSPGETEHDKVLERYRGPFVRIEGNVASPRSVSVINTPSDPVSIEGKRGISDLEQRVRVTGFGSLCSSTLSTKYDPKRTDPTWLCVFCGKGSHAGQLGDLFGPYFVSAEAVRPRSQCQSPVKSDQDLAVKFILGGDRTKRKKRRKSADGSNKSLPRPGEAEVWFHEDCVCWMTDIRLVGNVILGLEAAISTAQKALCSKCHGRGSTLGCFAVGCKELAHFYCAKFGNWSIDETNFQARCSKHRTACGDPGYSDSSRYS